MPFTRSNNKAVAAVQHLGQEVACTITQLAGRIPQGSGYIPGPRLDGSHQGVDEVDPRENEGILSEDGMGCWMQEVLIGRFK